MSYEYECYCEPQEGDPCEVWNVSWRRARKEHKCIECVETIKIGARYEYTFTVFEGNASSHKTCEFCANEWERLLKKHDDIMQMAGGLACTLVWDMRNEATKE